MHGSSVTIDHRSLFSAKVFEVAKRKAVLDGRNCSHGQLANQVTNIHTLKEWWSTVKSSINIQKKILSPGAELKKNKSRSIPGRSSKTNTILRPILKKQATVFPSDFDVPTVSDLYYSSQLSMPKFATMPVPWIHPYPAPVGYYSLDNFHMKNPLQDVPMASPNIPNRQTSLAWNEEVEVVPALPRSKYNRKPDADATYMNLTPNIKSAIRDELNHYKMNEMVVHEMSMSHTVFH